MRKLTVWLIGMTVGLILNGGCMSAPAEKMIIDKRIQLSPGHRVTPYKIIRAANGDLIVLGSNNAMDYKPWATRIAQNGDVRWDFVDGGIDGWADRSVRGQRFYGAVDMPDGSTMLCGIKVIDNRSTTWLVKLDQNGKPLTEKLLAPIREHVVNSLYSCHKQGDGILIMGSVSGLPSGTGWMAKLDWDFNLLWKKFSDDYGLGDYMETREGLIALGWHDKDSYVVKLSPGGDVLSKTLLAYGENYLVQEHSPGNTIRIVYMPPEIGHTEVLTFDDKLQGPKNTLKLKNVGVNAALALSDSSLAIYGSQFTDSASAAVTRVYKDGRYVTFPLEPPHESPWYIDAVLTGSGDQIAAVRQVGVEQGVLDFLSFK